MLLLSLPSLSDCSATERQGDRVTVNRCKKYLPTVIREARYHNAPYHYIMGQIEQESGCRQWVTAFDGGMGLGQFMPETAHWIHEKEQALREYPLNPYDPKWAIRATVLYDRYLYDRTHCEGWYYAFRAYNGGLSNLNREIRDAGACDIESIERCCKRKVIALKNGGSLDLCKVNIEYPYMIFQRARKYVVH